MSTNNKAIKRWKQNHPEMVSEHNSRYYAAHKEQINKKKRERYHQQKQLSQKLHDQPAFYQHKISA